MLLDIKMQGLFDKFGNKDTKNDGQRSITPQANVKKVLFDKSHTVQDFDRNKEPPKHDKESTISSREDIDSKDDDASDFKTSSANSQDTGYKQNQKRKSNARESIVKLPS